MFSLHKQYIALTVYAKVSILITSSGHMRLDQHYSTTTSHMLVLAQTGYLLQLDGSL